MKKLKRSNRILIGAECYSDAGHALAIAELLEAGTVAEVSGLLLEDRDALESVLKTGGKAILRSGRVKPIAGQQVLQRAYESDAKAFRDRVRRYAEMQGIQWSFERCGSASFQQLCNAAGAWDWLLIGQARISRHGGDIVVIAPKNNDQSDAAALATSLSKTLGIGTLWLDPSMDETALLRQVNRTLAKLVLIDAAALKAPNAAQIKQFFGAAQCSVLLLSASNIHANEPRA